MSKSWTPEELAAASAAMKGEGHMSYEEFCAYLERCTEKVVVVHLADGDAITTPSRISGTTIASAPASIWARPVTGWWRLLRWT